MEVWLIILFAAADARFFCAKTNFRPLELGEWDYTLKHIDSAVVENDPVSISEGQVYVYHNYFPDYIIKYVHVDNLAMKSCGASAEIQKGGIGNSSILIVLHAAINQEIRSVVDIWGQKIPAKDVPTTDRPNPPRSMDQFKTIRAVNHNSAF